MSSNVAFTSTDQGETMMTRRNNASGKARQRVLSHSAVSSDPKFKKYVQQVEKCLATFESVNEWPDFIAFLKLLLKTLQSYMQFKEIPRKLTVAKRLSQCLNPALPSGVHQRALDVYSHILAVLGPDGLKRDLQLWSSGLFPFSEYASTSVKPMLLNAFEMHYLPLQDALRPVMKSFILALLPGLEEETGEFFDKVLHLLDQLSGTVSPSFFLQNMWLVMLTTTVHRAYALNYLSRRLPRMNPDEDITPIVGRDIGLMIRAFAAALEDDNLLVQRGTLDLLTQSLRADSISVKNASAEDKGILMRAAAGVVLRRDLSLNRRLYAWLLGPEEVAEKQVAYFQANALDLLCKTLRHEMFNPSSEYSHSRPFSVFISLLDKWEVALPLTEVLAFDAFKAIKKLVHTSSDSGEDVLLTGNSLYEAVEPRALWKHLYKAVRHDVTDGASNLDSINLFTFVLKTFRSADEEVQSIHLPLIFSALVEILTREVKNDASKASSPTVLGAMHLLEEILRNMPVSALKELLQLANIPKGDTYEDTANMFYGLVDTAEGAEMATPTNSDSPFQSSFTHLTELSRTCAAYILEHSTPTSGARGHSARWQPISHVLLLVLALVILPEGPPPPPNQVSWDPRSWLEQMLQCVEVAGCPFVLIDRFVSFCVSTNVGGSVEPAILLDNRKYLHPIVRALLDNLRRECSPYHVRAVKLIWALDEAVSNRQVESIIAHSLTSPEPRTSVEAFEIFGIFWRLSDDAAHVGLRFKIPMLIVLDAMKSEDPVMRRVAETWIRCSLKTYTRILDPVFYELLDPAIRCKEQVLPVHGRDIRSLIYERPFDQHRVLYLLEILVHVAHYGGQGFTKALTNTTPKRSGFLALEPRLSHLDDLSMDSTYLRILVHILLRFLQSEPKPSLQKSMHSTNSAIHAMTIDLLNATVSRLETDVRAIETIETIVTTKLFYVIHSSRHDIQNKLLHLLHSVISASVALGQPGFQPKLGSSSDLSDDRQEAQTSSESPRPVNTFLVQTLIDGIMTQSNRALLSHWLDFVTMTVSQFPRYLGPAALQLNSCVCKQLRQAIAEVWTVVAQSQDDMGALLSSVDDAELNVLLNAMERLVLFSLPDSDVGSSDDGGPGDRGGGDTSGLLTYVSHVFSSDSHPQITETQLTTRSAGYRALQDAVGVLYLAWDLVSQDAPSSSAASDTLTHLFHRTWFRIRKVLERFFHAYAFEVIELVVEYWQKKCQEGSESQKVAFEVVDFLTSSAQNVVHMICESISLRVTPAPEKTRKQVINPSLTDAVLFAFLENYLEKLEGPIAAQVWGRYLSLAKDIASNTKENRNQVFAVLRCTTVLVQKISQTTLIEDRRTRKDIQDVYGKLFDASVLLAGRSFDQGLWIRRATKDSVAPNGRDTPMSRVGSESRLDEKFANAVETPTTERPPSSIDAVDNMHQYLATKVVPNLRRFLMDSDRVTAACNHLIYYIVTPALKSRPNRPLEIDDVMVKMIEEMSGIPAAVKSWRNPVIDVFNDTKFFSTTPSTAQKWLPIIRTLIDTDKTTFAEVLSRIVAAPSTNIFTNREYEMMVRSHNLRRISCIIFSAEKNHFLTQLPSVQGKLVDIIRNMSGSAITESEVYLCVRVLLCRLTPHNLAGFWPVLLAELYRIFEQIMLNPPTDGSEDLQVILSACKLLDLLLVLQTQEFQIHQWIFITDTVDAIYKPDNWLPEALMDLLAEIVDDLPVTNGSKAGLTLPHLNPDTPLQNGRPTMRRPLLRGVKQIESIRDLAPFFSHVSIMSYESVYASGGAIDWEDVENGIMEDMFEGR